MDIVTRLDKDNAKIAYNWFHHSYPNYKNNEWCTNEDITLRNKLERFLIANGE